MSVPEDDVIDVQMDAPSAGTEQPAPADAEAKPEATEVAQPEAQDQRDERGRFKGGVQGRIDEITRQKYEAEREAAYWKGVASREHQGEAQKSAAPPAAQAKPTPDKFDDYGDYLEALTDWKASEQVRKAMAERDAADQGRKAQAQQSAQAQAWAERQQAARAAMPDYDAVLAGADMPIAKHVADALIESEHGPALAYHLAKHPDVVERLNGLDQRAADREIGRLEERLSAKPATEAPQVRTTSAPKPAAVSQSQGRATSPRPDDMSVEEYVAFRSKGAAKARWAR